MKWKTIINVGLVLIIIVGGLFVYSEISGQTILEILPFFQKPIIAQAHLGTLTISGTTELCGSYNNVWDKIVVTDTGVLNICEFNGTAETGFVNISLGPSGNFTVYPGGLINGSNRGSDLTPGIVSITVVALQGRNGNNWSAGTNATRPNGGGGGGGLVNDNAAGAGGGGGGFGGAGGKGGNVTLTTGDNGGIGGLTYSSTTDLVLRSGSGGGGGSGDATPGRGARGGAGFKVNAGLGVIMINGFVNLSGEQGGTASGQDSGGGGAGSGGHLILYGSSIDVSSSTVNVSGGRGGSATGTGTDDAGGGGGSGGRVYIVYSTLTNTSVTYLATGGVAGSGGSGSAPGSGGFGTVTFNQTAATFTDNAPKWSFPMTNNTNPVAGASVNHSVNWTDDGELSFAVLEVNGTGASCDTTANVTSMVLVGTSNFSNLTWEVPAACAGKTIGWRIYAKDFPSNQTNVTALQMYDVQAGASDTCTYTSGNWNVLCSDNCVITSNVALGGNAMTITGTGTFTTEANITQYSTLKIKGTDVSNKCRVRCFKGGCFKH